MLDKIIEKYDLPSLCFGVFNQGNMIIDGFGIRKIGEKTSITLQDKFHLGSCGKILTSTLIHKLVEEQKLNFKETIDSIFPEIKIHKKFQQITIAQLLTHSSGLQENYTDFKDFSNTKTPSKIRYLLLQEVLSNPKFIHKNEFNYSNLGYIILGSIIEKITDKPFEESVKKYIFQVFKMKSAGFGAPTTQSNPADQPWGHINGKPDSTDNPYYFSPAGTIHSNIEDWLRFLNQLLKKEWAIKKPHLSVKDGNGGIYTSAALAKDNHNILWHDGSNTVNYARHMLFPDKNTTFLIVTNEGNQNAQRAIDEVTDYLIEKYNL